MNRWLMSTTVLVALLASIGCARQHAQTLAADILTVTQNYQAQRAAKAQTETSYYREQLRILRGALGGSAVSSDTSRIATEAPIEQTIAYGRIVTSARQDAYVLAETLVTPGGVLPGSALLKYLEQGMRDDRDAYLDTQQRQQQLRADLIASLEKLDLQESRLETITKKLEALKTPRSLSVSVEELFAIGRAIQKQIDEKGN